MIVDQRLMTERDALRATMAATICASIVGSYARSKGSFWGMFMEKGAFVDLVTSSPSLALDLADDILSRVDGTRDQPT